MYLLWLLGLTLVVVVAMCVWHRTRVGSQAGASEALPGTEPTRRTRIPTDLRFQFDEDTAPAVLLAHLEWEPPSDATLSAPRPPSAPVRHGLR